VSFSTLKEFGLFSPQGAASPNKNWDMEKAKTVLAVVLGACVVLGAAAATTAAYSDLAGSRGRPPATTRPELSTAGGVSRRTDSGFVGAGWSLNPDTEAAISEALGKAGAADEAGLTMVFYTPQHDPHRVAGALQGKPARGRRVVGMTTHDGILTSDGYHSAETGVLGVLSTRLTDIASGIGVASFDEAPPRDAAKLALSRALTDAKKRKGDRATMLVLFSTMLTEESLLEGLAEELGSDVPLIGGTAAGLVSSMERKTKDVSSSMIVDDRVVERGVAVTLFYAAEPFAWAYGGGFLRGSGLGGVITSADSRLIRTIDGKPAVDVYDEWLGGRLNDAKATGKNVQNVLAFYPLVQTVTKNGLSHNQFIRAWPSNRADAPGSLTTGANVHVGETINTSEGSENILLNRFAALPRQARKNAGDSPVAAGLFFYCAGALQTIPREHRDNLASLVQQSMGDIPWIGLFTWGEQASVPGIGNQQGNLMASTLFFPAPSRRAAN
jgi:hypothetical protein